MIIKLFTAAASMTTTPTGLESSFVDNLEVFWRSWNLRIFVILSFSIQGFLIIGAAFRKQRTSRALIGLLWLAYVLADWAAYYALGLISNSTSSCTTTSHGNLHGFWAPFLLLHLGGPSTITAFSLDDTSMWVRSSLNLIVQTMAALIAFIDLFPDNNLWIASLFIFVAAMIRYSDRVVSLYTASSTMSYAKDTTKKKALLGAAQPLEVVEEAADQPLTLWGDQAEDVQLGKDAFGFFEMYKGLYGDLFYPYTNDEWAESKAYFSRLDAHRAFELVEIELSLAYEVFYTKIGLIQKWIERILYPFSTTCVIVALVLWCVTSKDEYNTVDVVITYALLIGAILVDVFSALVILLSDWMITYLITSNRARYFTHLTKTLITLRIRRWATNKSSKRRIVQPYFWSTMVSRAFFPHWSESILQLNMVDYCFNDRSKANQSLLLKYYQIIGYPTNANISQVEFTAELRDFIFREIQARGESNLALGKADKLCSSKARWTLKKYYAPVPSTSRSSTTTTVWNPFAEAFHSLEFDECLLVAHVATELLHRANPAQTDNQHEKDKEWREISKILSDYMLYLLVLRQNMIFVPGCLWETLFPDTCAEFKSIAKEATKHTDPASKRLGEEASERFIEHGCKSENKVISRACTLATTIRHYEERRWEIFSKVWMEMTCHAAMHSRGSAHGSQLSRGGELLTFVWLMLAHFKIGKQMLYLDDDDEDDDDHHGLMKTAVPVPVPESPSTGAEEDNWPFETS